jgi:hypothetical protein
MSSSINPVSIETLHTLFSYDPTTGTVDKLQGRYIGRVPGTRTCIGDHAVRTSRVAWALYHNYWPSLYIDHKDGNPRNNRLTNLREATPVQNHYNTISWGAHGKGVSFCPDQPKRPYRARIGESGKLISLGSFATADEGQTAYLRAAEQVQGEFAAHNSRHGR